MTGKVFLNYRRADAEAWADRLFERLIRQFPRDNVFMDIDGNIPFGFPWAAWLDSQVAACDLMLVLIGRTWVAEFKARGDPDERDFVRVEIESALKRKIPVVPVFLGDAPVPQRSELPESVRPLLALQAARLQRLSFDSDAEVLVTGIARSIALARGEAPPPVRPEVQRNRNADGRIKVDAPFTHGVTDGRFLPGAGKTEWFRDHDAGPEMVVVPAGSFMMGSPADEERWSGYDGREEPQHKVTIGRLFAVGRHAVTRGAFATFVRATGHKMEGGAYVWAGAEWKLDATKSWRDPGFQQDDDHPVVCVSHQDAEAFAAWLGKATGKDYRLPTEAEWEYVCRAGTTTPFWWGASISPTQANYDGNHTYGGGSKGEYRQRTVPVECFEANPWGLYQVHGNVLEWVADTWHNDYNGNPPSDGSVWQGGDTSLRVLRGGSWFNGPQDLRSADRVRDQPADRYVDVGFRLARTLLPL